MFKPSGSIFFWPFQNSASFVDPFCYLCFMLSCLFLAALLYRAAKRSGNVSDCRYLSDCRSKGRTFDPGPVPTFQEIDHEIISISSHLLIHSRRVVVNYKRKYVHKVLQACAGKKCGKVNWPSQHDLSCWLGRKEPNPKKAALWSPAGKGWPLGSLVCDVFLCFCHFPIWCSGSGVVFDCIDSWSLPSFLDCNTTTKMCVCLDGLLHLNITSAFTLHVCLWSICYMYILEAGL